MFLNDAVVNAHKHLLSCSLQLRCQRGHCDKYWGCLDVYRHRHCNWNVNANRNSDNLGVIDSDVVEHAKRVCHEHCAAICNRRSRLQVAFTARLPR